MKTYNIVLTKTQIDIIKNLLVIDIQNLEQEKIELTHQMFKDAHEDMILIRKDIIEQNSRAFE